MIELKAHTPKERVMQGRHNEPIYLKSEADKVIADLEESHKKEVDQLLIEIVKLKEIDSQNRSAYYQDLAMMAKDVEHQKYKRCLNEASYWVAVSYQCVDDKHRRSAERHHRKWLELAEKFKDKEAK